METYLQGVIPALRACGHEIALLYKIEARDRAARIDAGDGESAAWQAREVSSSLPRELMSWRPDVVYLHEPPDLACHRKLLDAFPVVMFAHNYYGACATGRKMHAFPQPVPCARRCGPACLILHYPRRCGGLNPITMVRNYRTQMAMQSLLGRNHAMAVASGHMRTEYLRHGVDPQRIHVVPLPPSGVDPDPEPPAPKRSPDRLLFIGRLTDLKGVEYLLRAIRPAENLLERPLSLTVAGSGAEETRLRGLARQLGLTAKFTGWLDFAERTRLIRESDLLVTPSLWPEPFGLVGIEAGCMGVPAVAYDVGGIKDWLHPGASGELAPGDPPTVAGLTGAIVRALADPAHYQSLCRGAWETARTFTLASHLQTLLPILESAAGQGASAER